MKKILLSIHIFIPFILQFYFVWVLWGSRKKIIFRTFPPSFRGYGGEMLYLVCQFLDIFSEQQKTKTDISRPCCTLWNTILKKKKSWASIVHWVFNFQSSLCEAHYQHYKWQNRSVEKWLSKSEVTKAIKPAHVQPFSHLPRNSSMKQQRRNGFSFQ